MALVFYAELVLRWPRSVNDCSFLRTKIHAIFDRNHYGIPDHSKYEYGEFRI